MTLAWLDRNSPFPSPDTALREPNGLLAAGADLSPERLVSAYRRGIFPWFEQGQPVLWWSPDPRAVLFPEHLHISRRLARTLKRGDFHCTLDLAFDEVMRGCAGPRRNQSGTWITPSMREAYGELHRRGIAHSVETWRGDRLVGGIYGLAIGSLFCGESMFSRETDASKVALVVLVDFLKTAGYRLMDCQVANDHTRSLGVEEIPRVDYLNYVETWRDEPPRLPWPAPGRMS